MAYVTDRSLLHGHQCKQSDLYVTVTCINCSVFIGAYGKNEFGHIMD